MCRQSVSTNADFAAIRRGRLYKGGKEAQKASLLLCTFTWVRSHGRRPWCSFRDQRHHKCVYVVTINNTERFHVDEINCWASKSSISSISPDRTNFCNNLSYVAVYLKSVRILLWQWHLIKSTGRVSILWTVDGVNFSKLFIQPFLGGGTCLGR